MISDFDAGRCGCRVVNVENEWVADAFGCDAAEVPNKEMVMGTRHAMLAPCRVYCPLSWAVRSERGCALMAGPPSWRE